MEHNIYKWFEENYPNHIEKLKNSDHAYDKNTPNPYHLEGDCLTHTKMVFKEAINLTDKEEILLAALLHDVGKPKAREVVDDKKRVRFFSHENYSTAISIDILIKYKREVNNKLDIVRVLELINWHSDFHNIETNSKLTTKQKELLTKKYKKDDLFEDMCILSTADTIGRIIELSRQEQIKSQKEKINFLRNKRKELLNHQEEIKKFKYSEDKTKTIKVLIGLPNSGKSTYIKTNKQENEEVLSFDDILLEEYEGLDYNTAFYKMIEDKKQEEIEKKFNSKKIETNKLGKNMIIDKTNLSKKSRRKLLSNLKKFYKKKAIMFIVSRETLEERNKLRKEQENKSITEKTYEKFMKTFTMPDYSEFDEIEYIFEENQLEQKMKEEKEQKKKNNFSKKKKKKDNLDNI